MRYGDVIGKGTLYDGDGALIFHGDECLLESFTGEMLALHKRHKAGWKEVLLHGPGCYALTNERLVFLREPGSYAGAKDRLARQLYSFSDGQYWPEMARRAGEAGAKEFFEARLSEVKEVKLRSKTCMVLVDGPEGRFRFEGPRELGVALEAALAGAGE